MVLTRFLQEGDEYVAGWFRDISQRARDEARLRESEQRFHLLFEEATDGLAILEPVTLRVVDCNQRTVAMFDAGDKQALIGRDGNELQVHPFTGPELPAVVAGAESGKLLHWELEFLSLKGRRFWASVAARRITLAGRRVTFVRLTDITERKQMESSMIRTQRLESIGVLAGGIAHDLNNILSPILLSADLLGESFPSGPEAELVSAISSNARRGTEVVRQVLSFSRDLKSGRVAVDFRPLIEEIRRLVHETFPRNIRFECHTPPGVPPVLADPTQMHQVLLNLSVNARDAMPDGGVLRIELASLEPGRDGHQGPAAVCIRVIDTGTGIPDDVRAHMFEPFFTTKPDGLGTGLGLTTVATIVERHGGTIAVESAMQHGTTFTLVFPAAPADASCALETKPARHPRGRGETILVIDDEESVRTLIEKSLEHCGYRVLTAADGAAGLSVFSQFQSRIDIVLTDLMMPVMSGQAVIRQLRGLAGQLPVVAMSGDSIGCGGRSAAGGNDALTHFLPKPFTIEQLLGTVRAALDQRPGTVARPAEDPARQTAP
jgi:PAS domain S-box-containing protein